VARAESTRSMDGVRFAGPWETSCVKVCLAAAALYATNLGLHAFCSWRSLEKAKLCLPGLGKENMVHSQIEGIMVRDTFQIRCISPCSSEIQAPDAYKYRCELRRPNSARDHSGMWAYKRPADLECRYHHFLFTDWCLATIAHDSFHSKLYHDYKKLIQPPCKMPHLDRKDAERRCRNTIGSHQQRRSWMEIKHTQNKADGHYVKGQRDMARLHKEDVVE